MTKNELLAAMQFGSACERSPDALGKFGMGLKTAALSQGRSLTVITRKSGKVSSYRWTAQTLASGWNCEELDPKGAQICLNDIHQPFSIGKSGTLIIMDGLDHVQTGTKGLEATLQKLQKRLSVHLGLTFHRFLDNGISFYVDSSIEGGGEGFSVPIGSLDPFSYPNTADKNYPMEFSIELPGLPVLKCKAHIWPPNQTSPGHMLSGGNVVNRQGFYFYRHNRLIQAGGWTGWRENESDHHLALARVAVELLPEFDTEFRLNVQKSALNVPEEFRSALGAVGSPMARYIKRADEIYRKKTDIAQDFIPVPGRGFCVAVGRRATACLAGPKMPKREINVLWKNLSSNRFFIIDRISGNIVLNALYRTDILCGATESPNDAPVLKILLFLLLRDDLLRERESKRYTERLEEINDLLMLALKQEQVRQNR